VHPDQRDLLRLDVVQEPADMLGHAGVLGKRGQKDVVVALLVMMIDSDPVNCGTPACLAMSMLATVLELYTVPKTAKGLSLSTRRMTATDVGGSVCVSCTDVSSFMPRTPPFLLMCSTARLTASRHIAPTLAPPPVISATIGILATPCGLAGDTAARTRSIGSSASFNRADRMENPPYALRASAGAAPTPPRPAA